jgi:hypothetical protein
MCPVDSLLLDVAGGAASARVVVLPTASAPDGTPAFQRWAERGRAHFATLGAGVDVAMPATREDANDPATFPPPAYPSPRPSISSSV